VTSDESHFIQPSLRVARKPPASSGSTPAGGPAAGPQKLHPAEDPPICQCPRRGTSVAGCGLSSSTKNVGSRAHRPAGSRGLVTQLLRPSAFDACRPGSAVLEQSDFHSEAAVDAKRRSDPLWLRTGKPALNPFGERPVSAVSAPLRGRIMFWRATPHVIIWNERSLRRMLQE
jgi:hypothetical protein